MAVFQDEIKVLERLPLDNGLGVSVAPMMAGTCRTYIMIDSLLVPHHLAEAMFVHPLQ
jgi:hypothetical protein